MANGEEAKTQVYFTPKKKEMVSTQVNVNVTIFNFQRYKLHAMLKNLKNQMVLIMLIYFFYNVKL